MSADAKSQGSAKSGWAVLEKSWEEAQKKAFTKWCNAHLVKKHGADAALKSIGEDFVDGIRLMQLVNALYGNSMPAKYNKNPKMRPQRLDNIELSLAMLDSAGVKTHFLKPVHLVDSDVTMILGMIWAIILDYQIKGISVEELSAKEGLLLWCQKKTAGYRDVKVENFTTSWQDGLAFCALIHKHRPDLLNFDELSKANARENLQLAFDVAEKHLGIPKLLDVEDIVDVPRPDERSIVTYVSEYFHCFASQNQYETASRRIAKAVNLALENEKLKVEFINKAQQLVDWINSNTESLKDRTYAQTLESIEEHYDQFKNYTKSVKPEKTNEKLDVEAAYNNLQAKLRVNNRPPYVPPEHLTIKAIDDLWGSMGREEKERSDWLRRELQRQQRLEAIASRFWRKAAALLVWGNDNKSLLSSTDYGTSVAAVQAKLKNHEGFEANYQSTQSRLDSTLALGQELIQENYGKADQVQQKIDELNVSWAEVRQLADARKSGLEKELERQLHLDNLRSEFATRARVFVNWIEDAEDTLAEPVKVHSLEAIQESLSAFETFSADNANQAGDHQGLGELAAKMVEEGIEENMYAQFTIDQINERWERLQNEVTERKSALEVEHQRHQENDELCKQFGEKAAAFVSWIDEHRNQVSSVNTEASVQDQLATLRQKGEDISNNRTLLEELVTLNNQIDERNIVHNRYTEESIESLNLSLEKLLDLVASTSATLEKELLAQTGSKVSEEQLAELRETFKQFDKSNNGTLEKHEFKACLNALGQYVDDEQAATLVNSLSKVNPGHIVFEEFVDYMVSKIEDSDTPSVINGAFKTIAGEKDFVTEEELRRVLEPSVVDYLVANMPSVEGGYDFRAFTEKSYRS